MPWPTIATPSLPDHCLPQNQFLLRISSSFHTCVPTPLAFISTLLGSLSILSWLFAQLPQIFKNYSLQATSGLSIFFLMEWCLGDTTNLLGALLTRQATWQITVAGYYVCVDVVLVSQYIWYTYYKAWRKGSIEGLGKHSRGNYGGNSELLEGIPTSDSASQAPSPAGGSDKPTPSKPFTEPKPAAFNSFRFPSLSSSPREKATPSSSHRTITRLQHPPPLPSPSPKAVLFVSLFCAVLANASPIQTLDSPSPENNTELVGRLLSWTSTFLYLSSRLPQIYQNYSRRSTAGLSPGLFIAAFFGNLFYSSSLLTNPLAWASYPPYGLHGWVGSEGSDRATWVALASPFWLGAAGVLALDATIGLQFLMFGEERTVIQVKDAKGRGHWRKVSGWMRGWVPSPSPEITVVENQRPLLERNGDSGGERIYGAV
ncbi:MAG: hypothetical protein Q9187_002764 [Circinaria calcarea]